MILNELHQKILGMMQRAKWKEVRGGTGCRVFEGVKGGWVVVVCGLTNGRDCTATAVYTKYDPRDVHVILLPRLAANHLYFMALDRVG